MTWIETSGRTIEEAKEAAAIELGVPVDLLQFEIMDEDSKRFLGFGQPKVRVRASALDTGSLVESNVDDNSEEDQSMVEESGSLGEQALSLLETVLSAMQFNVKPELVSEDDEDIQIALSGDSNDIGRLIGRHGQTLDALQYIVGIAVNRSSPYKIRTLLDAEGYRERHKQMLEAKAFEIARQVKELGEEAVLEPQSARDRRIVHVALADDPDVDTYSEGEGEDRHVVISPRK